ncbi:MAG: 2-hydroxyacid dehydrogenase [Gammaproteobacteria bacterium]|jgi:glycerate dehydrogenase|nr:2-hydroxyacid dehydrogenase [Gammaproteobacteria bacterium]
MAFPRAVFLDLASVDRGDLDLSPLHHAAAPWTTYPQTSPELTAERVGGAAVAVTNKVVIDRAVIAACPGLRLICVAATGTNNVDLEAAREHGIAVCNVTGYATPSVVQHVLALMLALTTRLAEHATAAQDGRWAASDLFCLLEFPFRELAGKTLGIVGFGELGRGVERVAQALGMSVLIAQRPGGPPQEGRLPLDELLARADVVTLHVPLADNTRGLIGAQELALMKPDALLINTARGGIVDEAALVGALRAGRLGGAGVDVLAVEPPRDGSPLLDDPPPNLIVTPHVAWASREARQRLLDEVALNIVAFSEGRERNRLA